MPLTHELLDQALAALPPRPRERATVADLCVRPGPDLREPRTELELSPKRGALGDRWERKTWMYLPDGRPDPRVQVAVCNTELLALMRRLTGCSHHPGDTLFTALDLSEQNLPAGSLLRAGAALLEVSDVENDACAKFARHYGDVIFTWIRLPRNRPLRLRGLFARVVSGGTVRVGDPVLRA
jgi:hypothetical protein